jgi:N-acetylneuraminate synthase/N,N'-diacetyllegionaminate synthase
VKRPGTGIPPSELDRVIGRTLARAVAADELLEWGALIARS